MEPSRSTSVGRALLRHVTVALSALALTAAFFLILPVIQAIGRPPEPDTVLQTMDAAVLPPPPPPPIEEEPEPEPEEEPPPPDLLEEAPPLDLAQLDLALNPGMGDGWFGADFALQLNTLSGAGRGDDESIFSLADLDQRPRVTYQPSPQMNAKLKKSAPGTVYVLFIVNEDGRVEDPKVQKSTDPLFENPALAAVKKWRFEPGKRNGQPVSFRMRVPITFPKG